MRQVVRAVVLADLCQGPGLRLEIRRLRQGAWRDEAVAFFDADTMKREGGKVRYWVNSIRTSDLIPVVNPKSKAKSEKFAKEISDKLELERVGQTSPTV